MAPRFYGRAAETWSREKAWDAVRSIALRVDAAIGHVTRTERDLTAPDVEMHVGYKGGSKTLFSFPDTTTDMHETLKRISETDHEREQRQKRNLDTFLAFRDRLTEKECHIILDHFGLDEFRTMMELNLDLADRWYELFMLLPEARLPAVHNLVLLLAHALAGRYPAKAGELFRKIENHPPLIRITLGDPRVSLDAMAVWGGPDEADLDSLCFQRLDGAANDHVISQEVLAAHLNGREDLIHRYIGAKLERQEPVEIAHALMAVGFSDHNPLNDDVLDRYRGAVGFIGDTHDAARYAYDRNRWARHWFERMCEAHDSVEFWRFSILFTKIVDGRFDLWQSKYEDQNEPMLLFGPSIRNRLQNRFRKWEDKRKKKLFGQDVPAEIFLLPWRVDPNKPK